MQGFSARTAKHEVAARMRAAPGSTLQNMVEYAYRLIDHRGLNLCHDLPRAGTEPAKHN